MRLGKSYLAKPVFAKMDDSVGRATQEPIYGKCVYIHPKIRYITLEFDFGYGAKVRESFRITGGLLHE